jgi:outer membrane protein
MIMKKILSIAALFLSIHVVQAQSKNELNNLILQSFSYFPRIQELNKTSEVSEMRIELAQSNYLPSVSGLGTYSYVNPVSQKLFPVSATETSLLRFQPFNNYNFNLGINQLLWDFGKTQAQIEKAKADLLVSQQNSEAAKLLLGSQIATIYYSMIFLRNSIRVQDSVISFYVQNKKIVEGKIKHGDGLQIDLSTMENNIDQEKNRKVEFERQYNRQVALMRYSTGQAAEPTTAEFDFQKTGEGDLTNNPELMAANQRIFSSQADAKLADRNRWPILSLQGGAGFRNGYQPNIDPMRFNYLGGVTLNVPIFQSGKIRQNMVISDKTVEINELSKANLVASLQKDVESVQSDLKAYQEQITNAEGQIVVATETRRLTEVRYRQGVVTYLDLINASTNLQRAYLSKLQYQYQKTLSEVELCRLLGIRFWQ